MDCLTLETSTKLDAWHRRLLEQKGARDQLAKNLKQEQEALEALTADQLKHKQAHAFLMSELTELRNQAIANLENIASTSLKLTYSPDYALVFDTFDEKKSDKGIPAYQMEMRVTSKLDGELCNFLLQGGKGGGLMEVVSTIMRDAMLAYVRYPGFIMYDEVFNFLSRDNKMDVAAELMKQMAMVSGRQYLFVTHLVNVFAPVANAIVRLYNEDGIVRSEHIQPQDIVETEENYGTEEED